jgi:hypothetical protein
MGFYVCNPLGELPTNIDQAFRNVNTLLIFNIISEIAIITQVLDFMGQRK